ncbi:hypothetical protein MNEG_11625 [Monoraphidium neglectum]|uniref:Uncharacterized protein n=1 Tax=Monoraphidium neglectum TaxID=145388 RepID=A0A0D2KKK0_9CHLO|nr:hypothetical protein MNEG_11625 [Monoraphidium neglectum]KIY96338.1 hypothetical protein MNEG_11625 [Monoraphidium neglectum]|eukprot:XP_013895358.1 hypothetical protein MNEG_11625 [Monoraphidium neglectum]
MVAARCVASSPSNTSVDASTSGGRRAMLLLGFSTLAVAAAGPAAAQLERPTNKEVDNDTSPFIQELLRRTEEKREERKQQRLNDYYKRNFPEYFKFDGGSEAAATARGLSPETAAAMRKWLEDNEDQPMPGLRKRD